MVGIGGVRYGEAVQGLARHGMGSTVRKVDVMDENEVDDVYYLIEDIYDKSLLAECMSREQRDTLRKQLDDSGLSLHGYIPVFDIVTSELGLTSAIVFGVYVKHCLLNDSGICNLAKHILAKESHLSLRTFKYHTFKVSYKGYLVALNPEITHRPLAYGLSPKILDE